MIPYIEEQSYSPLSNTDDFRSTTMLGTSFVLFCLLPIILGIPLDQNYKLNEVSDFVFGHKVLNPQELAEQAGYTAETHEIITEDRYILQVQRITGSKAKPSSGNKPAVLLIHGLLDCAATWVFPGPGKGFALLLADWGYDVWLGNVRGSRYSRKHLDWTVSDKKYWNFSWHEQGMYDLPAMIDYILDKTKQKKIYHIGHSQGGTAFFVMASERPEYQRKIVASFNLAPAVFMGYSRNVLFRLLATQVNNLKFLADLIGVNEFKPSGKLIQMLAKELCDEDSIVQPVCSNIIFLMGGFNDKDLNQTLIPLVTQYDPAGASTMQFIHYAQLMNSGRFQKYDYGLFNNLSKYRRISPPDYDLASIKTPVYIHYGKNDVLTDCKDELILYNKLPNATKFLVPYEYFTHLDFVWGKHVDVWVYRQILSLMKQH